MRRFFFLLIVILTLLYSLQVAGGYFVGQAVSNLFERGTGARVSLKSARLDFFPPGASAKKLIIKHAKETGQVSAETVSVKIILSDLFKRQIHLSQLVLTGTSIRSTGKDSGFFRLLRFILKPNKTKKKKTGWKVSLDDLYVYGRDDLELIFEEIEIRSTSPRFVMWKGKEEKTFSARLSAKTTSVGDLEGTNLVAKQIDWRAILGKGQIRFENSDISGENKTSLKFSGDLGLNGPGFYKLLIAGDFTDSWLKKSRIKGHEILPGVSTFVSLAGKIQGKLKSPILAGDFKALPTASLPLLHLKGCSPKKIKGKWAYAGKKLSLSDVNAEKFLLGANLDISFNKKMPFKSAGYISFKQSNSFYKNCLKEITELLPNKSLTSSLKNKNELGKLLKANYQVEGFLSSKSFKAKIGSDITGNKGEENAGKLAVGLNYRAKKLDLRFSEKPIGEARAGGSIKGSLSLDFHSNTYKLQELEASSYPTLRLITRIFPFFPKNKLTPFLGAFSEETRLTANLTKGNQSTGGNSQGLEGQFALVNVFGKQNAECDFSSGTEGLELSNCLISSVRGVMGFNGLLRADSSAKLRLWTEDLALSNFTSFAENSHKPMQDSLDAELVLERSDSGAVEINGSGKLSFLDSVSSKLISETDFNLSGNAQNLLVEMDGPKSLFLGNLSAPVPGSDSPLLLNMKLRQLPLRLIAGNYVIPKKHASGHLSGLLKYQGPLNSFLQGSGSLKLEEISLAEGGVSPIPLPLTLQLKDGRINFQKLRIASGGMDLVLDGYLDHVTGWNANLVGEMNLGDFPLPLAGLEQLSGTLEADLNLKGQASKPVLDGRAKLSDGILSFTLGDTIVGTDEMVGDIRFEDGSAWLQNFQCRIGQGTLKGSGTVRNIFDQKQRIGKLDFNLSGVEIQPTEHLNISLAGLLALSSAPGELPKLSGDLQVDQAFYEDTLDVFEILDRARTSIVGRGSASEAVNSSGKGLDLAIKIQGQRRVIVETNVAKLELAANLELGGTSSDPRLDGIIKVNRGSFGLQSDQFQVISGEIEFATENTILDPELNILGETFVYSNTGDNVPARISITGSVREPIVAFSSDSGLSEEELVAILGVKGNSLTLLESSDRDVNFFDIINPGSDLNLSDRLTGLTGFTRLGIDSTFSETTGELVPLVTAERKFTDSSTINLESELRGEFNSEVSANYPLTDKIRASAGWRSKAVTEDFDDSRGSFGLDFIYERRLPGFQLFSSGGLKETSKEMLE